MNLFTGSLEELKKNHWDLPVIWINVQANMQAVYI